MSKLFLKIDLINEWTGRICGFAVVILTAITFIEVVMRYFFNHPTIWSFEVAIMIFGFHFMMNMGHTMLHNGHVCIELIYIKLSRKGQAILDIVGYSIFFFPFILAVLYKGTILAAESWAIKEVDWGVFPAPVYLYKTVIPVSVFLMLIQGIAIIGRSIMKFQEGSDV